MQLLDAPAARQVFNELFDTARTSMFKVEVLQDYSAIDDSPSLRAWTKGDKQLARKRATHDKAIIAWRNRCLASPADIIRIHIIKEPLTPYLEWEIEMPYKESILKYKAEDVRLVHAEEFSQLSIPDGDFWIFDDAQVLEWIYGDDGLIIGGKVWKGNEDITPFLNLKKELLINAESVTGP